MKDAGWNDGKKAQRENGADVEELKHRELKKTEEAGNR